MSLEHRPAVFIPLVRPRNKGGGHQALPAAQDGLRLLDRSNNLGEDQDHEEVEPADGCLRAIGSFLGILGGIGVFSAGLLARVHVVLRLLRPGMSGKRQLPRGSLFRAVLA